jgi:hypothetical protein
MVYQVIESFEFSGRVYLIGDLIKLTDEEAKQLKGKIVRLKKLTKEIK